MLRLSNQLKLGDVITINYTRITLPSLQLIARASEHCVIRSSPSSVSKQCILTILLDCMVLFTPDYLVNLVKRLRVYVKVIMKQATQSRMFKRTCNQLYGPPASNVQPLRILFKCSRAPSPRRSRRRWDDIGTRGPAAAIPDSSQ